MYFVLVCRFRARFTETEKLKNVFEKSENFGVWSFLKN